jgi:hypothetical protein
MHIGHHPPTGELDLTASAAELHDLAALLNSGGSAGDGRVLVVADPGTRLTIGFDETTEVLSFTGDPAHLSLMAENLDEVAEMDDGGHWHVYFSFLSEDSLPLVVNSPYGGMPGRTPPDPALLNSTERATRPDCPSRCFVCGFDYRTEPPADWPWGPAGTDPTFHLCVCCGTEFGYEDATLGSARKARKLWADTGYRWADPTARPQIFYPTEQLKALPTRIRD